MTPTRSAAVDPADALLAATRSTWAERCEFASHLATTLGTHAAALERAIADDTDTSRPDAAAEVRAAIDACVFYGRNAQHWSPGTNRSPGLVTALTPLGFSLWRLTRLALPVLVGGGAMRVTRPGRSVKTLELMVRAVESAGFSPGTLTMLRDDPRPQLDVRTRRATYNYGAYPLDSPGGHGEPIVVADFDKLPSIARGAVRRAGAPGSPVLPTTVRLVATPSVYEELCHEVANAVREARGAPGPNSELIELRRDAEELLAQACSRGARPLSPSLPGDPLTTPLALAGVAMDLPFIRRGVNVPLILLDVAFDVDSALDLAQGTVFGLGALLWDGAHGDQTHAVADTPWQISEVWSGADRGR